MIDSTFGSGLALAGLAFGVVVFVVVRRARPSRTTDQIAERVEPTLAVGSLSVCQLPADAPEPPAPAPAPAPAPKPEPEPEIRLVPVRDDAARAQEKAARLAELLARKLHVPSPRPEAVSPSAREEEISLPARVLFVDVETTGLRSDDRIVSLGAISLETHQIRSGNFTVQQLHLIFDPGKKSHPAAEKVHGWSDWTLRHQDSFADHASLIMEMIQDADLLVAHNASFDIGFLEREFALLGQAMPARPVECTMVGWRERGLPRASLTAVCKHLGVARRGETHGALEDASLAMQAWLGLHVPRLRITPPDFPPPCNLTEPPPIPEGPLPRRSSRKRATP